MSDPFLISESNVSRAWLRAVKTVNENSGPMCVSIVGLENGVEETPEIRADLDSYLKEKQIISVRETSETIFPFHYWSLKKQNGSDLVSWYIEKYLPRHQARVRKRGAHIPRETYFERLVAYKGHQPSGDGIEPVPVNQLKRIIDTFHYYHALGKNPSPSKFIATCLNPSFDNTGMSPYLTFPCLQQVGFSFVGNTITVTGYYTIQYLVKRGYGNYLGLCHLGEFISKETGLPLTRVNCFVGNPRIDNADRKTVSNFIKLLE